MIYLVQKLLMDDLQFLSLVFWIQIQKLIFVLQLIAKYGLDVLLNIVSVVQLMYSPIMKSCAILMMWN